MTIPQARTASTAGPPALPAPPPKLALEAAPAYALAQAAPAQVRSQPQAPSSAPATRVVQDLLQKAALDYAEHVYQVNGVMERSSSFAPCRLLDMLVYSFFLHIRSCSICLQVQPCIMLEHDMSV